MALGNVIAKLSVALAMDTSGLEKGAKKSESILNKLANFLVGPAGIAAMAGTATAMLIKLGKASIDTADEISKAAQSIGIGTEELSRLRYAADISGTSFEQLTKGVGRLSRNMNDAARGLKAPARAFNELGIEVKNSDGTLRTASEVIGDLADKFAGMEDGAKKTALAQEMLGRAGADMIPFLNQGRDGIQQLTDEADRFGVVIDEETGRKAEEFNDNLSRLGGVFNAVGTRLAAELLPQLLSFTDWLVNNAGSLAHHAGKVAEWAEFLIKSARYAVNEIKYIWDYAGYLDSQLPWWLGGTGKNVSRPINQNRVNSLNDVANRAMNVAKAMLGIKDANERVAPSFTTTLAPAMESAGKRGSKAIRSGISDELREAQREAENFARMLDRLFPEVASARGLSEDLARLDREMKAGTISADQYREASRRLFEEFARNNQPARMPELLQDVGPLEEGLKNLDSRIEAFGKRANATTVRIAKSFKDMADDTMASLNRLSSSIQSGGFLGILEGIIGLGLQLGSIGAFGKNIQRNLNRVPAYANGTNFHPGGLALVGERGPELVSMPRGSRVTPNNALGGVPKVEIIPSAYFDVVVDGRVMRAAPAIADAGAQAGVSRMAFKQTRRL